MKKYLEQGKALFKQSSDKISNEINSQLQVVKGLIGDMPILASFERVSEQELMFDEKHYFVIPFKPSPVGFSLHTMRNLPQGVPEVNDLPKRRVFHFANEHYQGCLTHHMLNSAKDLVTEKAQGEVHTLEKLADDIDSLDNKLTNGMLFVGGLTALVNPLLGVGIAAKAILPSAAGLLTKYGLRPAGEKLSEAQLRKQIDQAQAQVSKEFSQANTIKVINPILQELELAINTTAAEHDPLTDPNLANGSIPELNGEHWRELTERAVYHVYKDTYEDSKKHQQAALGPEDIRWFDVLFANVKQG